MGLLGAGGLVVLQMASFVTSWYSFFVAAADPTA
jgi:hypothetical protein